MCATLGSAREKREGSRAERQRLGLALLMQTTSAASHSGAWLTPKASPRRRPGETPSAAAAQTGTLDASLQSMLGDVEADVEKLRERREVSAPKACRC